MFSIAVYAVSSTNACFIAHMQDYPNWSAATRAGLTLVAEGSMDALGVSL